MNDVELVLISFFLATTMMIRQKAPFSVAYDPGARISPYSDWVARGRPEGTVFMHSTHCIDDIMRIMFMPSEGIVHIDVDLDYYSMVCTMVVCIVDTPGEQSCSVTAITCKSDNHWPTMLGPAAPNSMVGTVRAFQVNLGYLARACIVERLMTQMFGRTNDKNGSSRDGEWRFECHPYHKGRKVRRVTDAVHQRALNRFNQMQWDGGPWHRTVGTFDATDTIAAKTIQAAWRGWQARKQYRYNPYTRLGAHLVLRDFTEMVQAT
jgi:IQ calmodulin-binding motif